MTEPVFNPKIAFIPVLRASPDDFWLALGLIAGLDAIRLSVSPMAGLLSWLVIAFFVMCVFMNRLRDAGRAPILALVPLSVAAITKMLSGLTGMVAAMYPGFLQFLERQGIDTSDPVALNAAAYNPDLQQAYQSYITSNPEQVMAFVQAGVWPSTWGFWLVLAATGFWAARLR